MNYEEFLAWEKETKDVLDFKTTYVDVAGDLNAGLMLSVIVYWYLPDKNGKSRLRVKRDGFDWIACTRYEWWNRIRLSTKQADRAIDILEDKGLVEIGHFKFNGEPTVHIRLVVENFTARLEEVLKIPPTNPYFSQKWVGIYQMMKSMLLKRQILICQKRQVHIQRVRQRVLQRCC